jgi:hypothetical protein
LNTHTVPTDGFAPPAAAKKLRLEVDKPITGACVTVKNTVTFCAVVPETLDATLTVAV